MRGGGTLGVMQSVEIGVTKGVLSKEIFHLWPPFLLFVLLPNLHEVGNLLYYITIAIMCCHATDLQTKGQAATD